MNKVIKRKIQILQVQLPNLMR